MKVLFVSALLPYPLYSGGQIRIYNLLKRLSENHEISLFSFIRSEKEKEYISQLSFCKKVVTVHRGHAWRPSYIAKSIVSSYPFLMETYHNSQMEDLLSDEVTRHDLVHIEPGYVWPSIPALRIPVVVAEHNIEHGVYEGFANNFSMGLLRPLLRWDIAKLKFWEKHIWTEARRIVAVSGEDASEIKKISGKNAFVVPNGVDLPSFPFKPKKIKNQLTFLYVGNFKWMENRDAAGYLIGKIWPEVMKMYPGAKLRIVGRNAPPGKYFFGDVDTIQDELYRADIMLAPIRIGSGTKYKILESMATGLPVITTTVGAKGFDKHVLWIANTPEEFVACVGDIIKNSKRIYKAREIIERTYNWDSIAVRLQNVWENL